jgi:hypothetical protein
MVIPWAAQNVFRKRRIARSAHPKSVNEQLSVVHSYNVNILLILAAIACAIGGLVAWVIILIDAFNDDWWKGLLFFIPIYAFFYAIFEFEHDRKWEIVCLYLAGTSLSLAFLKMAT